MTQRSPLNDRYKVEQKGKTRKSASAAKPKRAAADVGTQSRKKSGRSSAWSRAKSSSAASRRAPEPKLVQTERYKRLTRYMWTSWAVSLVGALGAVGIQSAGGTWLTFLPIAWIVYFLGIGTAFYLQFVPIRAERQVMVQAARSGHKADKHEKSNASKKSSKAPVIEAPREGDEPDEEDSE